MPEISITGRRCRLRDWRPDDVPVFAGWQAPEHAWHDTNGPYFGKPTAEDIARTVAQLADRAHTPVEGRPEPRPSLAVVDLADRLVGHVTWYWESEQTNWRRMGVVLYDPTCHRRGIGTQAMALWTTYLFVTTTARRLDFATYSGNPAMCAIGRRLGFVEEGRFRDARAWDGHVYDSIIYGVLRAEWRGEPTSPDQHVPAQRATRAGSPTTAPHAGLPAET